MAVLNQATDANNLKLTVLVSARSPWLFLLYGLVLLLLTGMINPAYGERIKDLAVVEGIRDNPLLGYGLVVGLDGTGDNTGSVSFTEQSLRSMLQQFGVTVPPTVKIQPKNVAAVSINAVLPPFTKPGQTIDITLSSLGNSKSLRGGTLLMAPLKGVDGKVYAVAQGNVIVAGIGAEGADGSSVTINIPSVGRIPGGATVERSVPTNFNTSKNITFNLHQADFTTAKRVEETINKRLGSDYAQAIDAVSIEVTAPDIAGQRVEFLSFLEELEVEPGSGSAKIIINSRTGTIVIGNHVTVMPAAVSHGSLTVTIDENVNVNQPNILADGETAITPETEIDIEGGSGGLYTFKREVTLQDVVEAINQVGATTNDLISILEALSQVGALSARLVVI